MAVVRLKISFGDTVSVEARCHFGRAHHDGSRSKGTSAWCGAEIACNAHSDGETGVRTPGQEGAFDSGG